MVTIVPQGRGHPASCHCAARWERRWLETRAGIRPRPGTSEDVADEEARYGLGAGIGEVHHRRASVGHLELFAVAAIALVPRLDGVLAGGHVLQGEGAFGLGHVVERIAHHTDVPEHP